jgi:hypothetical protein
MPYFGSAAGSAIPYFATASIAALANSGVTRLISCRPTSGLSHRRQVWRNPDEPVGRQLIGHGTCPDVEPGVLVDGDDDGCFLGTLRIDHPSHDAVTGSNLDGDPFSMAWRGSNALLCRLPGCRYGIRLAVENDPGRRVVTSVLVRHSRRSAILCQQVTACGSHDGGRDDEEAHVGEQLVISDQRPR